MMSSEGKQPWGMGAVLAVAFAVVMSMGCGARPAQPRAPAPEPAEEPAPLPVEEPPEPAKEPAPPPIEEPPKKPRPKKPRPKKPPRSVHLQLGIPRDATPEDDELLERGEMAIGYSRYLNAANWVSWRTTAADFGDVARYGGDFLVDKQLPEGWYRPSHADYTNSGYDRGHMVRSEERTSTAARNKATFVMSNVLPQTEDLNRGPWYALEQLLEEKVHRKSGAERRDAYVIAGAVWPAACATHQPRRSDDGCRDLGKKTKPEERVAIPEATFKIIVFVAPGQPPTSADREVIAVLMPNKSGIRPKPWRTYQTTVKEIERRTHYDFLSRLDAAPARRSAAGTN